MAIGRLFVCGMLILAVAFIGQIALHPVPLAVAQGPGDSSQTQGARMYYQYLPLVGRDYCSNCYYVDSINGSDANPGTSLHRPWRTLAPVHAMDFSPGSAVYFKRGSSWTDGLVIDDSGEEGSPITFTAYGTGDRPTITNPGRYTRGVKIKASWVVVEGLLVQGAHVDGVYVLSGYGHNIIRDLEITDVGSGITLHGHHNLATGNYIHDLHMIVNTPGGDDDYGATAFKSSGPNNEVAYNRIERCSAPSYDYDHDGGGFELLGTSDGNYIHHNFVADTDGFLEVGMGSARDVVIAYNLSVNNGRFSWLHLTGDFAGDIENMCVEHNTIVESGDNPHWVIFGFHGYPDQDTFILRNNVVYVDAHQVVSNRSNFTHYHNLYQLSGGTELGFAVGQRSQVVDPLFIDRDGRDFHLQSWSPAIDGGVDLGYARDLEGHPVPIGTGPDLGAFEYQGTPAPTPTPDPNELIIDDRDAGFLTSFSQDPWQAYTQVQGQHYGDSHCYNGQIGTGQDTATWLFTVPRPGRYKVYAWWWESSWRPTDVPYTINHLNGSSTVRVDQQTNGGQWNLLGTFDFQDRGSVVLSDDASSGRDMVADAIRLYYLGALPLASPTAGPTLTPTPTPVPPTATATPAPPTATPTQVPPTATATPTSTPPNTPTPRGTPSANAKVAPVQVACVSRGESKTGILERLL
jgi:hypothetical protein